MDRSWLADDQLAQRLATTNLDWSAVEIDERLKAIWAQRRDYMSRLDGLPEGIAHGDFSTGNLRSDETGVIVLDWATLGRSRVGFDLAHLALSTQNDSLLPIYLEGLNHRFDPADVELGYRIAVSLIGSSRAHWMARWSKAMPVGYTDFVTATKSDQSGLRIRAPHKRVRCPVCTW